MADTLPRVHGIRFFDTRTPDRIARSLQRGGSAVVTGRWEEICRLYDWLERRKEELVRLPGRADRRARQSAYREALDRLLVNAVGDELQTEPPRTVPRLSALCGLTVTGDEPYLVPVRSVAVALRSMQATFHVDALGASLTSHQDVLAPRSQETIHLIRQALELCELPPDGEILDMGCGSGVCALLAAHVFPGTRVVATDHLPAAIATTAQNAARLAPGRVELTKPGDLFTPVGGRRFHPVIFNAPWVVAPARNVPETALCDRDQATVRRFLTEAPAHLHASGRLIIGYADHSGPRAIERLERFIADAGFDVVRRLSDRIRTHRKNRAWERVFAYECRLI